MSPRVFVVACAALATACAFVSIPDLSSNAGHVASDAGDAAAGGDAFSCNGVSPAPKLCDDFDHESALTPTWDQLAMDSGESIDKSIFLSPPGSLLATLAQGGATGACDRATVEKRIDGHWRRSRVSLSLRFAAADLAGSSVPTAVLSHDFAVMIGGGQRTYCQSILDVDSTTTKVFEQILTEHVDGGPTTVSQDHLFKTPLQPDQWNDVVVDYNLDAGTITATVNGQMQLSEPLALTCPPGGGAASVQVGLFCIGVRNAPMKVHYDNVTFDTW